jgi:hypothetical protein
MRENVELRAKCETGTVHCKLQSLEYFVILNAVKSLAIFIDTLVILLFPGVLKN